MSRTGRGTGRPNPCCETKFSGANGHREIFIFPVQLITGSIGNLTRLIHTLLNVMTIQYNSNYKKNAGSDPKQQFLVLSLKWKFVWLE